MLSVLLTFRQIRMHVYLLSDILFYHNSESQKSIVKIMFSLTILELGKKSLFELEKKKVLIEKKGCLKHKWSLNKYTSHGIRNALKCTSEHLEIQNFLGGRHVPACLGCLPA